MKSKRKMDNEMMVFSFRGRDFKTSKKGFEQLAIAEKTLSNGDIQGALKAFELSTSHNNPIAFFRLGQLYYYGKIVPKDLITAVKHYRAATLLNLDCAKAALGFCLYQGLGVEKNINEAIQLFISVPKNECNSEMLRAVGDSYYAGINGVPQNFTTALTYYNLSSEEKNLKAQKAAMYMYVQGEGCKKNMEQALKYSESLTDLEPGLMADFGLLYQQGTSSRKPDYDKALRCYHIACDQGHVSATYNLAHLYFNVLKKLPEAMKYFQLSAERGCPSGQYFWGIVNLQGKYFQQDLTLALKYFNLAAEQNNSDALCMLGICYTQGFGVEIDLVKAFDFFKKVEETHPTAQLILGLCYLEGKVVPRDANKAFEYFKKAATKDLAAAKQFYGICLVNGIGCKANSKIGKEYLEKAETTFQKPMDPPIIKDYLNLNSKELKTLADITFENGLYPLASAHYEQAVERAEDKTIKKDLLLNLAELHIEVEDYDAALNVFERILQIMPNYQEALHKKIVCLGLKNEIKAACYLIEKNESVLLPFVKESQKPLWAQRIYQLYIERQCKKAEKSVTQKLAREEKKYQKQLRLAKTIIQQTEVFSQQEEQVLLPETPVETVPQSIPQIEEKKQYEVPPKCLPKMNLPDEMRKAFQDIKQRIGAQSFYLIGSEALYLILTTLYPELAAGFKNPRNWNFLTTDSVENLRLIQGQFLKTDNQKLYINTGECIYENKINLYCAERETIGLFSIHQLAIDSEGNISGPESAFKDLENGILRFIRTPEEVDQTTCDAFLAKFTGSKFRLSKKQAPLSLATQHGFFAPAANQQEDEFYMTSSKIHHTLSFRALTHSKIRLASIKKDLAQLVGTLIAESDLPFDAQYRKPTEGSQYCVEFYFTFENLADLQKMQELIKDKNLSFWEESNHTETLSRLV